MPVCVSHVLAVATEPSQYIDSPSLSQDWDTRRLIAHRTSDHAVSWSVKLCRRTVLSLKKSFK